MASGEPSERRRLAPVISTLLHFTPREVRSVEESLQRAERGETQIDQALTDISSSLESWLGLGSSFFRGNS
jgi:hypothetical protein